MQPGATGTQSRAPGRHDESNYGILAEPGVYPINYERAGLAIFMISSAKFI